MQTIKLLPLVMAMTGAMTAFNSYADTVENTDNTFSNYSVTPNNNTTETSGFYLSGQLGAQFTGANLNTSWIANDPKASANSQFQTSGRTNNLLGGVALGYQTNNNLRFELAYNDDLNDHSIKNYNRYAKKINTVTVNAVETSQIDTSLKTTMANAYYTFDTGSNFSPFIMAGLGIAHVNASGTENETGTDSSKTGNDSFTSLGTVKGEENNFAWNVGIGGSYQVMPNLYLDGMVNYVNAGQLNLTGTAESKNNAGATAKFTTYGNIKVNAINMLLGIRYVF